MIRRSEQIRDAGGADFLGQILADLFAFSNVVDALRSPGKAPRFAAFSNYFKFSADKCSRKKRFVWLTWPPNSRRNSKFLVSSPAAGQDKRSVHPAKEEQCDRFFLPYEIRPTFYLIAILANDQILLLLAGPANDTGLALVAHPTVLGEVSRELFGVYPAHEGRGQI